MYLVRKGTQLFEVDADSMLHTPSGTSFSKGDTDVFNTDGVDHIMQFSYPCEVGELLLIGDEVCEVLETRKGLVTAGSKSGTKVIPAYRPITDPDGSLIPVRKLDTRYRVGQRVAWNGHEGFVKEVCQNFIKVFFNNVGLDAFPLDGVLHEKELTIVPYLELSEAERDYKKALINAGASNTAADYAVFKAREWVEPLDRFAPYYYNALSNSFQWSESPWEDYLWYDVHKKLRINSKIYQLIGGKPSVGDVVIAWDDDMLYTIGLLGDITDGVRPYCVDSLNGNPGNIFKNARCLKV